MNRDTVVFDIIKKERERQLSGIELIAAVSAPSSFAIEAARKWNITLCGFVRSTKLNIYTHSNRILSNMIEKDASDT